MNSFRCHIDVGFADLVIRDHRVHAVRVLPGVTFFDLVLRALQARGIDIWRMELTDVLFSEPVVVDADQARRITLSFEERAPQLWSVRGVSRPVHAVDAVSRENFACTVRPTDAPAPPPAITSTQGESFDLEAAYAYARAVGIEHFDFMKGQGRIEFGPERLIAHIAPSALAREHADEFLLHPACLDSATLVPFLAAVREDEQSLRPFIPIHVARFRAWAPIRSRYMVVVERASCLVRDDIFRSDIDLCDPDTGACLARFEALSTKRIRSPQLLERLLRPAAPESSATGAAAPDLSPPSVHALIPAAGSAVDTGADSNAGPSIARIHITASPVSIAEEAIRALVAVELGTEAEAADGEAGFYDLGLESAHLLSISAALGERLGVSLYPTLLFERSSILALAEHLAEQYEPALERLRLVAGTSRHATAEPAAALTTLAPVADSSALNAGASSGGGASDPPPVAPDPAPTLPPIPRPHGDEPIAVIGMAGRYADADNVEALWRDILVPGRDCIEEIPLARWDHRKWFDPDRKRSDRSYAKWGSFLPAVDLFDPVAFSISPRDAELMDPQERLFLEVASETFSDAGYAARVLAGTRTGVFVGVMWRQYEALGIERSAVGGEAITPMSFSASVANRVSHHFDLHGPSLALDSMCSSSLSALHLACESLRRGESELALAGGVNLILHPSKYLFLSRNNMLASDGRCRSFGDGGDGYVPGEGVGAVLLKPLSAAERDGDAILGVIRASAVNHGGRAGGYTVPDPDAQAEVIAAALTRAGIAPHSIGYIEAHGTGTRLGDPIEVRGMEKALAGGPGENTDWRCAIGSIKSNLGHLEAAAGIAGLTKVLLQLRHRMLAPSLHAQRLNPNIDFSASPFSVQRELCDWTPGSDGVRRAGISSFGAGGSNAHLIVEEYREPIAWHQTSGPQLIVLSARTQAQLDGAATRLLAYLDRSVGEQIEPDLPRVASTLAGRDEAFGVRAAIVVDSVVELRRALAGFGGLGWRNGEPGRRHGASVDVPWQASRDTLESIAAAYVDGASVAPDSSLPACERPRRCSLPAWPFNPRRCWLPETKLHPLLHSRLPVRSGACFETRLDASDVLLDEHRVDGIAAMPGVALAVAMLTAAQWEAVVPVAMCELRWSQMVSAEEGQSLLLTFELDPGPKACVRVLLGGKPCAQARVDHVVVGAAGLLPLAAIRARCRRSADTDACYRSLAARGLFYGQSLRVLRRVDIGDGEALAELSCSGAAGMPATVAALDGALQAVVALLGEDVDPQRWRPAGIDRMECWGEAPEQALAHLRIVERSSQRLRFDVELSDAQGQGWARLDGVELLQQLPVRFEQRPRPGQNHEPIRSFGERWVEEVAEMENSAPAGPMLLFDPGEGDLATALALRFAQPLVSVIAGIAFSRLDAHRYTVRPGQVDDIAALLHDLDEAGLRPRVVVHAWAKRLAISTLDYELDTGLQTLVAFLNRWFARRPTPLRLLYLHPDGEPVHEAIEGLARTAGREHHALAITTVALACDRIDAIAAGEVVEAVTKELSSVANPAPVRWLGGQRLRLRRFQAMRVSLALEASRDDGQARNWSALTGGRAHPVCLVSGGLGGLGRSLATQLAHDTGAKLILVGRRSPAHVAAELAAMRVEIPTLDYRQADIGIQTQAEALVAGIVRDYGQIDTVIHAAGVLRDGLLNRLGRDQLDAVLAAKLHGAIRLDQATRAQSLASFVLFSSVAGMIGNPGQAAYAYANRFLDRYAEARADAVAVGRAHGRSWSIAWPLWREGGMSVDASTAAMLERSLGMRPLERDDGLACLRAIGASDAAMIGFMAGEPVRIDAALELSPTLPNDVSAAQGQSPCAVPASIAADAIRSSTVCACAAARRRAVRTSIAALLMIDPDAIDLEAGADELGLDPTHLASLADTLQASATVRLTALRIRELPRLAELADLLEPGSVRGDSDAVAVAANGDDCDGMVTDGGTLRTAALENAALEQVDPRARAAALEQIRRIVAELLGLGLDEVDPEAPLREFGIDSITIVELIERLNSRFGVALAPAAVFELERIADLVDMVEHAGGLNVMPVALIHDAHRLSPRLPRTASDAFAPGEASVPGTRTSPIRDTDIAIIGMAGRFPGSPDLPQFWSNLTAVRDLIGDVPADRWDWRALDGNALDGPNLTRARWGGFIERVDRFDAEFFNISPKQAEWMDPQHRLMLETTWAALADAGCDPERLRGSSTGVFIGIGTTDYHDRTRALAIPAEAQSVLGRAHSVLPNRISYLLDLHGPSLPFETACSSSLVAVDQAVAALRGGRCQLALVGGVNLMLDPYLSISFDRAGMLSPGGRCRAFDGAADGYVRGEGLGMIVLKPLAQALADGDPIRAVIKGSAINHGGVAHALTAPNPRSQARLLVAAYRDAEIDPLSLGYIEAHGTGTALGDPIEVRALLAALTELHAAHGRARAPEGHCALGSVKANIGHLETAAGIAGLIKTVLCLEQRTIPGLAHFQSLNPQIDLRGTPLRIAARTEAWPTPSGGGPRRAGVSAFGFGGSNAHVVLEEAPMDYRARRSRLPEPVFAATRHWLGAPVMSTQPIAPAPAAQPESAAIAAMACNVVPTPLPMQVACGADANRRTAVLDELAALLSKVAKIPRERINATDDFEQYGLDSVLILELNHALRARFGLLPATVFYKYKTLSALAGYLVDAVPLPDTGSDAGIDATVQADDALPLAAGARIHDDIAIIGVSGRYPGAPTLDDLWLQLVEGRHAITEIPASRWDYRRYFDPQPKPGRIYCKWGGFIDGVDRFDAEFFGVAPWLARYMDPQERLFLEQAWACVEDAGYAPGALAGAQASTSGERRAPVGVFVGTSYNEYASLAAEANAMREEPIPFNTQSFSVANRVSYCLGLGGPSMSVDTACSSSLNAVHLACESLRSGACELAIAGGVNLSLHQNKYLMLCANRFAASDGRCRAFGEGGQGYVPGEGVGAVLLKPLAAALRDGDAIHALIKGSAVNHDGKTFGYTVPNPVAQTEVVRAAWRQAGIDPRSIGYIEAHGTGTSLGDPIEIAGLSDAFAPATDDRQFCAIGSIKSNIGHLEAAAGIASLHKVVLQLRHRILVPSLIHADRLNPAIDFASSPFRVQTERAEWTAPDVQPLRAGVSGFGAGGVNVHVLIEGWREPPRAAEAQSSGPVLVPLSARNGERLMAAAAQLLSVLERDPLGRDVAADPRVLRDLAFTLQTGREAFAARLAIVASDAAGLVRALRDYLGHGVADPALGVVAGHAGATSGGDAARFAQALANSDLAALAAAWVEGCDWPWPAMHVPGLRRRLHLPTYPFAGERYWIEPAPVAMAPVPSSPGAQAQPAVSASDALSEAVVALRQAAPAARAAACERAVAVAVAQVLEFEDGRLPDLQLGLFAMGLESVQSTSLVVRLERAFGLSLYPTIVFDHPSIRELSRQLLTLETERITPIRLQQATAEEAEPSSTSVLATPCWQLQSLVSTRSMPSQRIALSASPRVRATLAKGARLYEVDDLDALLGESSDDALLIADFGLLDAIPSDRTEPATAAPELAFARIIDLAKHLLRGKRRVEWVWVHALDVDGEGSPIARGLSGFARSLAMEFPRLRARLVGIDQAVRDQPEAWIEQVLAEAGSEVHEVDLRYRGQLRERRVLTEKAWPNANSRLAAGSVALISGGLGQLGLLIAERLGRDGLRIALLSRSEPGTSQQQRLDALSAAGVEFICLRCDVAVRADVDVAIAATRSRFGALDIVIHAAGCLHDSLLPGKSLAEVDAVLAPKLAGCRNLDAATASIQLQCFALFASTAGLTGNVGQTDYAFANAWLDGFAHERSAAVAAGHRHGRTVAFDWPLWAEGGMQVGTEVLEFMALKAGFTPMPSAQGLDLLVAGLAHGETQFAVFHGDADRIRVQFLVEACAADDRPDADLDRTVTPGIDQALTTHTALAFDAGQDEDDGDAIAIVGMACRLPGGCDSPEALWELLLDGRDAIGPVTGQRWDRKRTPRDDGDDDGLRDGGFLNEDPGLFDAGLFGISPREAADMDPQHRLLLEVSWHALESAGIAADTLAGSDTGVFVGMTGSEYAQLPRATDALSGYTVTGVATNIAAGRVARLLGVHGPALTVDTACSSSLMAVHLARQSLLLGESTLALAAGVNLLLSPAMFLALSRMGALAPDGRCKTFAAAADGYGRAEGCGVVVLERLADARRHGHRVLAVIRGSAVNHDGASSGLTVPNGRAQVRLLERALADAKLDPAEVGFVEAHGTGTPLGDPIELRALAEVYGRRSPGKSLLVGAVKANLGHLEAAAGIAGLIKAVLSVHHGRVPAQPGRWTDDHVVNTRIALPHGRVELALGERAWTDPVRIAGVSSFGFSGTNVHVLVGSPPSAPLATTPQPTRAMRWPVKLLCLSAASPAALTELAARWCERVNGVDVDELGDLCAASLTTRARMRYRAAVVGRDASEMTGALTAIAAGRVHPAVSRSNETGADVFAGLSMYVSDDFALSTLAESLAASDVEVAAQRAHRHARAQAIAGADPRTAAYADASVVVEVMRRCGLRPERVIARGQRLEFAAWVAGSLSFEDALALLVDPSAEVEWREADASLIDLNSGLAVEPASLSRRLRVSSDACISRWPDGLILSLGSTAEAVPGGLLVHDLASLATTLGDLHVRGLNIDCAPQLGDAQAVEEVPLYPMQRRRYWIAEAASTAAVAPAVAAVACADSPFDPIKAERHGSLRTLRYRLSHARLPELADNHGVLHIGQYLELLRRAVDAEFGVTGICLEAVEFRNALRLTAQEQRDVELKIESDPLGVQWSLSSRDSRGGELVHACGRLRALTSAEGAAARRFESGLLMAEIAALDGRVLDRGGFYARLENLSFDLGPSVRWIERVEAAQGVAIAEFAADPALPVNAGVDADRLGFHPGILDAGAQLVAVAAGEGITTRFMVVGMDTVRIAAPDQARACVIRAVLRMLPERDGLLRAALELFDACGRSAVAIDGISLRRIGARDLARIDGPRVPTAPIGDPHAFVRERVAAALDMDLAELQSTIPLRELGIDSIVGLGLARELREGLCVDVPAEMLLAGPSIEALLEQLGIGVALRAPLPQGRWFEFATRRAQPRVRLICLPFGAGAASAYRRWSALDPAIEVWPVQLPGRETRIAERPFDDLDALLDVLEAELPDSSEVPLALYGQSMGGLIAFELARRLQQRGRPPLHLFIGGLSAPSAKPNPYLERLCANLRARGIDGLPRSGSDHVPDAFWEVFREMPEMAGQGFDHLRPILPMVLADLALVAGYRHRPQPVLDLPITVFQGDRDDRVPHDSLAGWAALSRAPVREIVIAGDHFFISDESALPSLAAAIAAALLGASSLNNDDREPTCHESI